MKFHWLKLRDDHQCHWLQYQNEREDCWDLSVMANLFTIYWLVLVMWPHEHRLPGSLITPHVQEVYSQMSSMTFTFTKLSWETQRITLERELTKDRAIGGQKCISVKPGRLQFYLFLFSEVLYQRSSVQKL